MGRGAAGSFDPLASMESNAARARPNGEASASSVSGIRGGVACFGLAVAFTWVGFDSDLEVRGVSGTGVGEGDGSTGGLDGPLPKKFFNVVCRPENSSKNFVANLGGSGAVLGTSSG
jgi:hypothetical protein